jgi:hypothetical protein
MGNKSSYIRRERDNPTCIPLSIVETGNSDKPTLINSYVITNYNTQVHRFNSNKIILFKFENSLEDINRIFLKLTYDVSLQIDTFYKEGDVFFIKLLINRENTNESSFDYLAPYKKMILWDKSLKSIKLLYRYN